MEYTKKTQESIAESFRAAVDRKTDALLTHTDSYEIFNRQLTEICREFGCQYLGYNLIRLLHRRHGGLSPMGAGYSRIGGIDFPVDRISKPSAVTAEDKELYAQLLGKIAAGNSRFPIAGELAVSRFREILVNDRFLEDDGGSCRPIERQDILDIARHLDLDLTDTEELLFRTMEDGMLSDTSAADLIEKFVIVTGADAAQRASLLENYKKAVRGKRKPATKSRKDGVTGKLIQDFAEILWPREEQPYGLRRKNCLDFLVKNSRYLDRAGRTARDIYERLLLYVYSAMDGVFRETEKDVFDRIRDYVLGGQADADEEKPEQKELVEAVLYAGDCDSLREAYANWSVPTMEGEEAPARKELGSRMENILKGKIPVRKSDILLALFLACSLEWEYGEPVSLEELEDRLADFINHADILLEEAFLPKWYLPHAMESACALAIMAGPDAEDVFRTFVSNLELHQTKGRTNSVLERQKDQLGKEDAALELPALDADETALYEKLESRIIRLVRKNRRIAENGQILLEAGDVARMIAKCWGSENMRGIDLYFTVNGKIAYIPTSNIKKDMQIIGTVPPGIHSVLYGDGRVEAVFCRNRTRKNQRRYDTVDQLIGDLMPQLDQGYRQVLHRKAVMHLIVTQLEVFCGAVTHEAESKWNRNYSDRDNTEKALMESIMECVNQDPEETPEEAVQKDSGSDFKIFATVRVDKRQRILKIKGFDLATGTAFEKNKCKTQTDENTSDRI